MAGADATALRHRRVHRPYREVAGLAALLSTTGTETWVPLADLDGARHVHLQSLDSREGLRMLGNIVGAQRINTDLAAATDIVAACAGAALAIHLAAGKLIERPGWPLRNWHPY